MRKVDEMATKVARGRHEAGVKLLNGMFRFDPVKHVPFIPRNGQAVGKTKIERLRWRQWRDETFPARVKRRRRRKAARASARRNR